MVKVSLQEREKINIISPWIYSGTVMNAVFSIAEEKNQIIYGNLYNNKCTSSKLLFLTALNYFLCSYHQYT